MFSGLLRMSLVASNYISYRMSNNSSKQAIPVPMQDKLSILIIDDQPAMILGMQGLLDETGMGRKVISATSGMAGIALAIEHQPDLIILDVSMPEMNGVETAKRLTEQCSSIKILAVSAYSHELYVNSMLKAGASGYLLKENAFEEIDAAIQIILDGQIWIGRGLEQPTNIQ